VQGLNWRKFFLIFNLALSSHSITGFSRDCRQSVPFFALSFSPFLILLCPTPFFPFSIVFHSFPSISHGPYPIPSIFLRPSCSFYFSVSHYVPSISHYPILFFPFPTVTFCSFYFPSSHSVPSIFNRLILFLPSPIIPFCSSFSHYVPCPCSFLFTPLLHFVSCCFLQFLLSYLVPCSITLCNPFLLA
jgi:hypothetical protein